MRPMNSKAKRVEHLVMKFANERRASRGFDRLDTDNALVSAAREHSRDMAKRGYYDHFSERRGGPSDRVMKYSHASENIHKVYGWHRSAGAIAGELIDGWMTSEVHRENILKADYIHQGAGIWKSEKWVYATHMFLPRYAEDYSKRTNSGQSIAGQVSNIVSQARRII